MEKYANMTMNNKVKYRIKMLAIDYVLDFGLGVAYRVMPFPMIKGCLAIAKVGVDMKMIYDSARLMKHAYDML